MMSTSFKQHLVKAKEDWDLLVPDYQIIIIYIVAKRPHPGISVDFFYGGILEYQIPPYFNLLAKYFFAHKNLLRKQNVLPLKTTYSFILHVAITHFKM